jgi:serine/threonine-protein kinase
VTDQIRAIEEYVYARYIDPAPHAQIEEEEAAATLDEHFRQAEHASDPDCYFPGVLYFELGYENEERQVEYFEKSKFWLERARQLMGEAWEVIDDRLADLQAFFEERGIETAPTPRVEVAPPPAPAPVAITVQEIDDHGRMVLVPAGPFLFGPARTPVSIPGYYVDKYPVTNRQYGAFCRATGYRWPKYWEDPRFNHPDAPVVGVSVADAVKFARWVGKDLPTEEQFEKASRGLDGRTYPWGEDPPTEAHACFGRDAEKGGTDPVTAHERFASPFGAVDTAGNVWHWTSTVLQDAETLHAIKGGCFSDPGELLRCDMRLDAAPKDKYETIGFRCVKAL